MSRLPDIASSIEFAFVGRADAHYDRWRFFADVFGVRIQDTADFRVDRLDAQAELSAWVGRALVGYRAFDGCPDPCKTTAALDVFAGVRLYEANGELEEPSALAFSQRASWVDPLVAARVTLDFPGRFEASLMADIGGFGVGSILSWSASVEVGYRLSDRVSVSVGYSWLSIDYEAGGGSDPFLLDLAVRGPLVAVTFHF